MSEIGVLEEAIVGEVYNRLRANGGPRRADVGRIVREVLAVVREGGGPHLPRVVCVIAHDGGKLTIKARVKATQRGVPRARAARVYDFADEKASREEAVAALAVECPKCKGNGRVGRRTCGDCLGGGMRLDAD